MNHKFWVFSEENHHFGCSNSMVSTFSFKAMSPVGPYIPLTSPLHETLDVTIGGPRLVSGKLPFATLEASGKLDVWVGARIKVPVFITMIPTYPNYQYQPKPISFLPYSWRKMGPSNIGFLSFI